MLDPRPSLARASSALRSLPTLRAKGFTKPGAAGVLAVAIVASCLASPGATRVGAASGAPARAEGGGGELVPGNVVLVTIDGVRWQEIFTGADRDLADVASIPRGDARTARGLTPNLHRLFFDQGTVLGDPRLGEPFDASGPNFVSLPGYVEIMTGAVSGCAGNECEPHVGWAIASAAARASAPDRESAVFASWERIVRTVPAGAAGLFLHAGRGAGDEAPPYPGTGDYLPDRRTAAMAIDYLVRHRPRFLWISLGDTDEYAHRHEYRGYLDALRFADGFVGEIADHLAEMGEYGERTSIFVTTDHGRDPDFADHGSPASAGVWLMARGGALASRGLVPLAKTRHLRDIAPTMAWLLREPAPHGPEHGEVLGELL